jgi:hypothetical protein
MGEGKEGTGAFYQTHKNNKKEIYLKEIKQGEVETD